MRGCIVRKLFLFLLLISACNKVDSVSSIKSLLNSNGIPLEKQISKISTIGSGNVVWLTLNTLKIKRTDNKNTYKIIRVDRYSIRVDNSSLYYDIDTSHISAFLDLDDLNGIVKTINEIIDRDTSQSSSFQIYYLTKDNFGIGINIEGDNSPAKFGYAQLNRNLFLFDNMEELIQFRSSLLICRKFLEN